MEASINQDIIKFMTAEMGEQYLESVVNGAQTIEEETKALIAAIDKNQSKESVLRNISTIEMSASAIGAMKIAECCSKLREELLDASVMQCFFTAKEIAVEAQMLTAFSKELSTHGAPVHEAGKLKVGILFPDALGYILQNGLRNTFDVLQDFKIEMTKDVCAILIGKSDEAGMMAAKQIRQHNSSIPLLMITEDSSLAVMQEAITAGASDFISKPLFMPTLLHRLKFMAQTESAHQEIYRLAHYDALTGLPNRALFNDRLASTCLKAKRHQQKIGVMFIDLDGFKAVNDTLGHEAGDELLKGAASRMLQCVRDSDTVARLGGDEFVVIIDDVDATLPLEQTVGIPANRIINSLKEPFTVIGKTANIGASIGIAIFPDHGDSPDLILSASDELMYQVKKNGKGRYLIHS